MERSVNQEQTKIHRSDSVISRTNADFHADVSGLHNLDPLFIPLMHWKHLFLVKVKTLEGPDGISRSAKKEKKCSHDLKQKKKM